MNEKTASLVKEIADPEVVYEFFILFSRFEFALKRAGFVPDKGWARPEWTEFAKTLSGKFSAINDPEFKDACENLTKSPPKRQFVTGKKLSTEIVQREVGQTGRENF